MNFMYRLTGNNDDCGRSSVCFSKAPQTLAEFVISSIFGCSVYVSNSDL